MLALGRRHDVSIGCTHGHAASAREAIRFSESACWCCYDTATRFESTFLYNQGIFWLPGSGLRDPMTSKHLTKIAILSGCNVYNLLLFMRSYTSIIAVQLFVLFRDISLYQLPQRGTHNLPLQLTPLLLSAKLCHPCQSTCSFAFVFRRRRAQGRLGLDVAGSEHGQHPTLRLGRKSSSCQQR